LDSLATALRLYDRFRSSDPSNESHDTFFKQLTRVEIEGAMDAYEAYREAGEDGPFLGKNFRTPKDFWVRSSQPRKNRIFPSKPIHYGANGRVGSSGGWGGPSYSAAALHNSGFIIVDEQDQPVAFPTDMPHLIRDADRIRLCALNYFIAPARERGEAYVSIRAGDLSKELMLNEAWPNVCQALKGKKFQELAGVPPPVQEGPDASTTTTFTFDVREDGKPWTMKTITDSQSQTATNLILYGPPGTGKTYATAWEAVRLCLGDETAAPFKDDRDALMAEYRRLAQEGRIEFTTFHQSMSYEEFVEGLRPVTDAEPEMETSAGFRLEPVPGIFYRISERARKKMQNARFHDNALSDANAAEIDASRVFRMSIGRANVPADSHIFEEALDENVVLFGYNVLDWTNEKFSDEGAITDRLEEEGLGKNQARNINMFRNQMRLGDIVVIGKGRKKFRAIAQITGDYEFAPRPEGNYPHRRAVKWLWVDRDGIQTDEIYETGFAIGGIDRLNQEKLRLDGIRERITSVSKSQPLGETEDENFVLVIDEINRANISKVFGELITLLEQDKRLGAQNELRVQLPYSKKSFGVPPNLHIVGTMNTADRSIALLDTALRRRFTFQELMPDPTVLSENVGGINLRTLLSTINERIEYLFDREHQIGHAYFTGCHSRADVEDVMRYKVIPLLAEYFYEDWSKVAAVLGDGDGKAGTYFLEAKKLSPPAGFADDDLAGEKLRWSVKADFDFSEFEA
jgi:5-methylcytosine-specific restriction protein B